MTKNFKIGEVVRVNSKSKFYAGVYGKIVGLENYNNTCVMIDINEFLEGTVVRLAARKISKVTKNKAMLLIMEQ